MAAARAAPRHGGRRGQTRRLIGSDSRELEQLLATRLTGRPRFHPNASPLPDEPHIVVVLDGLSLPPDSVLAAPEGLQGVTVLEVDPEELSGARGDLSIVVQPHALHINAGHGIVYEGTPDALSYESAEALARQLAPLRMASGGTTTNRCSPTWSSRIC